MVFSDVLYKKIEIPEWMIPFLKSPEFVRIRGVRLSNVDSYEFKDFNGPTRWEHSIGVANLAFRCSQKKNLCEKEKVHLVLAALFHDIATPPFAHTIEYIFENFDHEKESSNILSCDGFNNFGPIFASQLPQFNNLCKITSKELGFKIEPDEIAKIIIGEGRLGFLINGSIDLDNIDNVTRSCFYLGIEVDKNIPFQLVDWLSNLDNCPTEVRNSDNRYVKTWLEYRNEMYRRFYDSSDEELGRQAFLQHLIRRAYNEGLPMQTIIWNTDDSLLSTIEKFKPIGNKVEKHGFLYSVEELTQRYRLLESPSKFAIINIENQESLRILQNPVFSNWLELKLSNSFFEPIVIINSRRYYISKELFPNAGEIIIFKLGNATLKHKQLPDWIRNEIPEKFKGKKIQQYFNKVLEKKINIWIKERPWQELNKNRIENIKSNLENIGNWSFRLTRNESIHTYPAIFVHAIPASLISALGLQGELIIDPFGGTGQTAIEAIKQNCKAISSDSNSIAHLIAKTRLSYLSSDLRKYLGVIDVKILSEQQILEIPKFDSLEQWHHPDTLNELCKIKTFINNQENDIAEQFLKTCFSEILMCSTSRKGKGPSYFADNTPLSKLEISPRYENAFENFIKRIKKNIMIIERFYSIIERSGRNVEEELKRAKALQLDIREINCKNYVIEENSAGGIITSPPYLCMVDYTLGQRLSYYWLFPEKIEEDFRKEVGKRRSRFSPEKAFINYLDDMKSFAKNSSKIIKKGGFLATVIGEPVAKSFKECNIVNKIDNLLSEEGFELLWSNLRPIQWHRNHGISSLKYERIAVHIFRQ